MLAVNHSIFEQLDAKQYSNQVIVQRPLLRLSPPRTSFHVLPLPNIHCIITYPTHALHIPPLPSDSTHESHQNTAEFVHLLIDMHQISGKDVVNPSSPCAKLCHTHAAEMHNVFKISAAVH